MAPWNSDDDNRARTAQLVRAAQRGDREALGALFGQFEPTVFAIARRRLGDYNEAEELCQDVFLKAMTKISQLRDPACFGGWLRSITHRLAVNRLLRRSPSAPVEPEALASQCIEERTPLAEVLQVEQNQQVRAGLERLRDLDREILTAFYVQGQSLAEMSDTFAAPLGTIKRRLHVARKRLAQEVEPLAV